MHEGGQVFQGQEGGGERAVEVQCKTNSGVPESFCYKHMYQILEHAVVLMFTALLILIDICCF